MIKRALSFLALGLSVSCTAGEVRLGKPLVQKLDWGSRSISTADMNGDGLLDVLTINNDAGKIDLLLRQEAGKTPKSVSREIRRDRWEPVLENAPFVRDSVVTASTLYALIAGDVDGDGLQDLIYTGSRDPLVVRFQEKAGGFSEGEVFDGFSPVAWTTALKRHDLDGDGVQELIVLGKRKLMIFKPQAGIRKLPDPDVYALSADVPYGLELVDVNRDGRLDILYELGNEARPFRVRLQDAEGGFERAYAFDLKLGPDVVQHINPHEEHPTFAYIQGKTGLLKTFQLDMSDALGDAESPLQPAIYSARGSGAEAAHYALGDFDGDGLRDVVVADASTPEMRWFRGSARGHFESAQPYPSLSKMSGFSAGRIAEEDRDTLLIISAREKMLALSRFDGERFEFPKTIALDDEPQTALFADVLPMPGDEILVVVKQKGDYLLHVLGWNADQASFVLEQAFTLDDVRRAPYALGVADLDGDAKQDIVVHVRREALRVYRQQDAQGDAPLFVEVGADSSLRKTLLDELPPERLGFYNVDDDPAVEMLVAGTGYVRALELDREGDFKTLDQFNARSHEDAPLVPAFFDIDGDGSPEILFYDAARQGFQVLEAGEDHVYRYDRLVEAGAIKPLALEAPQTRDAVWLLLGEGRFWEIAPNRMAWSIDERDHYETDLEDVRYNLFVTGNLNDTPEKEFILLDGEQHLLEILTRSAEGAWKSVLHFTVFDENLHYMGRKGAGNEPREIAIADFNADGRNDVLILVHDRLLIYPSLVD